MLATGKQRNSDREKERNASLNKTFPKRTQTNLNKWEKCCTQFLCFIHKHTQSPTYPRTRRIQCLASVKPACTCYYWYTALLAKLFTPVPSLLSLCARQRHSSHRLLKNVAIILILWYKYSEFEKENRTQMFGDRVMEGNKELKQDKLKAL